MPTNKFFDTVSKAAVTTVDSINLTLKQQHYFEPEMLYHYVTFHHDQMKSVRENGPNRF